jgi:hypothetical protein
MISAEKDRPALRSTVSGVEDAAMISAEKDRPAFRSTPAGA